MSATLDQARSAKDGTLKVFSRLAQVAGVGITRVGEGYGVKVNLGQAPTPGVTLPADVGGVLVKVDVVGTIRKQES